MDAPTSTNQNTNDMLTIEDIASKSSPDYFNIFRERAHLAMHMLGGRGIDYSIIQNTLTRLDRFKSVMFPWNYEQTGLVFITRPRLNLSSYNLKMHPVLSTLLTTDRGDDYVVANSLSTMIRALLDTELSQDISENKSTVMSKSEEQNYFTSILANSRLVDTRCPFLTPLCNALTDISGFADFILETETTQGGFFSEDLSYAKGSDMNYRSTELSLGFREIYGGIVLSILYIWCLYIALQCRGEVMAYPDDIYEQRINYTVSIYRFTFNASGEVITGWAKATGCFPRSVPIGAKFNISEGEIYSAPAARFSIPFVANKIEYMHPNILTDFNRLVKRYYPRIEELVKDKNQYIDRIPTISDNLTGLPYIVSTRRGMELKYFYELEDKIVPTDNLEELLGIATADTSTQASASTPTSTSANTVTI